MIYRTVRVTATTLSRPAVSAATTMSIVQTLLLLLLLLLLIATTPSAVSAAAASSSSFYRDVLLNPVMGEQRAAAMQQQQQQQQQKKDVAIQSALLQKATLRQDFEAKYGVSLDNAPVVDLTLTTTTGNQRKLEEEDSGDSDNSGDAGDNGDDYYMNNQAMYSFSGYSLKFAKCQPVQYFSETALQAGEHSPMVTNDIVLLRLCPTSSCSGAESANIYGCQYNYSEYALDLRDYVRIMLRYASQKRDSMCTYCAACLNGNAANNAANNGNDDGNHANGRTRRKLEDAEEGDEPEEEQQQQQQQQQANNNNNGADDYYRADDDYVVAAANAADDAVVAVDDYVVDEADDYYKNACSTWSTYCTDYADLCFFDDNEQENNNNYNYLDYDDYLDYLNCAQVQYNGYSYFVRPRCDGYQGTIKMAVYYDNSCVQYAGNEVSLKNLGLGFRESAFSDFYSGTCWDCSESENPPYDASSTLCNRLHHDSAKCTDSMEYDLFGGAESSHQTECSYIEALRFGTYNELGQLSTRNQDGSLVEKVTPAQKVLLVIPLLVCLVLVIYACYLHHAMTNLLIKSLSHRELLPPSRHAQAAARRNSPRRTNMNNSSNNSSRRGKSNKDDPDWDIDDNHEGEYA